MSKALKNCEHYIHLLAKSGPKRRALLNQVMHEELKGLCEICLSILNGNIPLSDNNFRKLKINSNTIKVLAHSKIPLRVLKTGGQSEGCFSGHSGNLGYTSLVKTLAEVKRCKKMVLIFEDQCNLLLKAVKFSFFFICSWLYFLLKNQE